MAEDVQNHNVDSIWSLISEDNFRKSLVALEQRTNAVPIDMQVFGASDLQISRSSPDQLPFSVEEQFVSDIAFIAAMNEGAQSVAAVCLEQHAIPYSRVVLRIAAADTIDANVRSTLRSICDEIQRATNSTGSMMNVRDGIFRSIISLHSNRILGRLRSSRWQKPKYLMASHKKPLWKDFSNVVHRVHHIFPSRRDRKQREVIEKVLLELAGHYEDFETAEGNLDSLIAVLVRRTFEFCKNQDIRDFYSRLNTSGATAQISAALKCMHQLEKIGSYYRIANNLVQTANQYQTGFCKIELEYLIPYPTRPTMIAHEPWAKTCHVHAEIQLVIDHDMRHTTDLNPQSEREVYLPRVIGTSKYFCYLCYLFIKEHGYFFAANTHGRLYDQWTVPDLAEYSTNLRTRYALLIAKMAETIQEEAKKSPFWRPEPMTSRQNLLLLDQEEEFQESTTQQSIEGLAERISSDFAI